MVEGIEHHDKGSHERVEKEVLSAMDVRFELLDALRNGTPIPDFRIYARARNTPTWYPVLEATYARVKRSPLLQGGGHESSLLQEDEEDGEPSANVQDGEEEEATYIFEPIDGNEVVGRALHWVTKPTRDESSVAPHVSRVVGASFDQCEFKLDELAPETSSST